MALAIITGAARGLGLETARGLAELGHYVLLTGRNIGDLRKAATLIGESAQIAQLDVAKEESVAHFFDWLHQVGFVPGILVNNAGRVYGGHADGIESNATLIAEALENNALGAWRMMQRTIPLMNAAGFGRIVNVSSGMGAGASLGPDAVPYRASKALLNALTRIAAPTCAPNVKVNAVCPGWVRTQMGGTAATRSLHEGVAGPIWAATLRDDGPHGGFFRDGKAIDW